MRCPKCGYISYDNLETCLKCKKDIKAASDAFPGAAFQVETPSFLQLQPQEAAEGLTDALLGEEVEDIIDEDLEVLLDEPAEETEITLEDDEDELKLDADDVPEFGEEEEDREIELDFSKFEELAEEEEPAKAAEAEQPFAFDMPEELADISDLAPPPKAAAVQQPAPAAGKPAGDTDLDQLDFNLELDDLELPADSGAPIETELSLDDLDFSDTLSPAPKKQGASKSGGDMDEELNFNLDLGGLSIHKDQ